MSKRLSKRAKARVKRQAFENFQKLANERASERAKDLGITITDFWENETSEFDIF